MTKHSGLIKKLAKVAPSIHFSVKWEPDHNFRWDGDGPDPSERGYQAYDVAVYARTIVGGEHLEGVNYLGGTYSKPGKPDPTVGGYLNQMLDEALDELGSKVRVGNEISLEIVKAQTLLKHEREKAYARQMKGRK